MSDIIEGKAWKFGDGINTDLIIPGKYKLSITDLNELVKHTMEGVVKDFAQIFERGGLIVAGKNFGCGSSREQAPLVLKHLGVSAIIARSFARIFFRNSINIGLPVLECKDVNNVKEGDYLKVDIKKGKIRNITQRKKYIIKPFPKEIWKILEAGGLVSYVKMKGKLPW